MPKIAHYFRLGRCQGFTLIQLLFAIAIATAVLTFTIGFQQRGFVTAKNDRTAYELQRLLEASIDHFMDKSAWPVDINALVADNYLPAAIDKKNPWGEDYDFDFPAGTTGTEFQIKTKLAKGIFTQVSPASFKAKLPNVTVSLGSIAVAPVVMTQVSSVGKQPAMADNPFIVDVVGHYHIGKLNLSLLKFCLPRELEMYNICKAAGRKHAVLPSISAFNAGSIAGGRPNKKGLNPYYGGDFYEIFLEKDTDINKPFCYSLTIAHPQNGVFKANRGTWAQLNLIYYCEAVSAGAPSSTAPSSNVLTYP